MYAQYKFHRLTGTRTEAELLVKLWTCWTILLQGTPDSLEGVWGLFRRIGGLPNKAALRFCCEGRSVLLRVGRALCVSVNCNDPLRSWNIELEVCIMWYHIESGKSGSFEQCVTATAEGDDIED